MEQSLFDNTKPDSDGQNLREQLRPLTECCPSASKASGQQEGTDAQLPARPSANADGDVSLAKERIDYLERTLAHMISMFATVKQNNTDEAMQYYVEGLNNVLEFLNDDDRLIYDVSGGQICKANAL